VFPPPPNNKDLSQLSEYLEGEEGAGSNDDYKTRFAEKPPCVKDTEFQ